MDKNEYIEQKKNLEVLCKLLPRYGGKTLENIIQGITARVRLFESINHLNEKL